MFKKALSILLCCLMVFSLSGCSLFKDDEISVDTNYEQLDSNNKTNELVINPLTGVKELPASKANDRPVAVMVNNVKPAQSVQKGLSQADIVYETYVEGDITRFMAVYKDISKVGDIGTVRSARAVYVDLAAGHNAIYVHCGLDPRFCKARINEIKMDDFDINTGKTAKYGFRVKNGKSYEHTMYTSGAKISEGIKNLKYNTTTTKSSWVNFAEEGTAVAMSLPCDSVTVPMSGGSYSSKYTYDAASGKYLKLQGGSAHKDTANGEQIAVKNLLVLFTNVSIYSNDPEKKHKDISLNGGSGYYISNGQYKEIYWKKGADAYAPLTFTNTDGSELQLNAGNTWVSIAKNSVKNNMKFEAATPQTSSTVAQ